ncbi:hypothetical protein D3877_12960 [Azospirillum cavernae]|uniref:Uncharacterized protein n=1 Tax=Azospirillum cavernae TaxID=2320860 RepID=A0A418VVF0_9PROT|nr:hypothetical protein [Azospirillum cavernae]RJF81127.1 hypothetical protein D3877_12960 [Azospirillum cavernae]
MTTSARQTIRDAFRNRLSRVGPDGVHPTMAGARVFSSRTRRIGLRDMPCILLFARGEKVLGAPLNDGTVEYTDRELRLTVAAILVEIRSDADIETEDRPDSRLDDRLDEIAEQIERTLAGWEIPGFEGADIALVETELFVDVDGAEPHGNALLTYAVAYRLARVLPGAEDPPIPTMVMASWSPDIGPPHEADYRPVADLPVLLPVETP